MNTNMRKYEIHSKTSSPVHLQTFPFYRNRKMRLRETSLHGKLFRREIVVQVSEVCMCYVTCEGCEGCIRGTFQGKTWSLS